MKKIVLSLFALVVLAGVVAPVQAQDRDHHHRRHCYYRHHHRVCR